MTPRYLTVPNTLRNGGATAQMTIKWGVSSVRKVYRLLSTAPISRRRSNEVAHWQH